MRNSANPLLFGSGLLWKFTALAAFILPEQNPFVVSTGVSGVPSHK